MVVSTLRAYASKLEDCSLYSTEGVVLNVQMTWEVSQRQFTLVARARTFGWRQP